jgi:hypothetical protein
MNQNDLERERGMYLGVRLAGFGVEPLADDSAVADDDAADHGVGAGVAGRFARQLHAPPHVAPVDVARLGLASHGAREAAAAKGGGADGAQGQVGARGEQGSHGQGPGRDDLPDFGFTLGQAQFSPSYEQRPRRFLRFRPITQEKMSGGIQTIRPKSEGGKTRPSTSSSLISIHTNRIDEGGKD